MTPLDHADPMSPAAATRRATADHTLAAGGLLGLTTLQVGTLIAAFTRTQPHPPLAVVPFIVTLVATGIAAMVWLRHGSPATVRAGYALGALTALASILVFGPQKFFTEGMPAIAPAVVAGIAFEALVLTAAGRRLRRRDVP